MARSIRRARQGSRDRKNVFAASLGPFEGITDSERTGILLDLLGRKVPVFVDLALLTAA
jgi:hypothetical protein